MKNKYLFRRRSARTLIVSVLSVLVFGAILSTGVGLTQTQLRNGVNEIKALVEAGEEMAPRWQSLIDQYNDFRRGFEPTPEEIKETIEMMRGSLGEVLNVNVRETINVHTGAIPFVLFWRAMALMLMGMGMMKAGVFTMKRSLRFYRNWVIIGFGLGLPMIAFGIRQWSLHNFDFISRFLVDGKYNYFASILVSMA